MIKILISLLLIAPVFAKAAPATDVKTNIYQTIVGDLLKNCTGVDKKISVAGFSYSDGRDSHDGGVVAERMTAELVKLNKFKVIERKEIEKAFEELKLQRSGVIDSATAKDIGKILGVDWLVVGTLTELPEKQLTLNTRLISVESAQIISAASAHIEKDWVDQYREILNELNKDIEGNSKDAQKFYERAVIYLNLGEYDKAITSFDSAIKIRPEFTKAYFNRGLAYDQKLMWRNAIADFSKAIAIDPKNVDAYYNRGRLYDANGQYEEALSNYSKALKLNPKYGRLYYKRGVVYSKRSAYDKAITDFSEAILINPKDADSYYERGLAYAQKLEWDKAANDNEKYRSLSRE